MARPVITEVETPTPCYVPLDDGLELLAGDGDGGDDDEGLCVPDDPLDSIVCYVSRKDERVIWSLAAKNRGRVATPTPTPTCSSCADVVDVPVLPPAAAEAAVGILVLTSATTMAADDLVTESEAATMSTVMPADTAALTTALNDPVPREAPSTPTPTCGEGEPTRWSWTDLVDVPVLPAAAAVNPLALTSATAMPADDLVTESETATMSTVMPAETAALKFMPAEPALKTAPATPPRAATKNSPATTPTSHLSWSSTVSSGNTTPETMPWTPQSASELAFHPPRSKSTLTRRPRSRGRRKPRFFSPSIAAAAAFLREARVKDDTPVHLRRCSHCGTASTPQWRSGPGGSGTLCNACGIRYKMDRLLPEYRPSTSPTFLHDQHSNRHKNVLKIRKRKVAKKRSSILSCGRSELPMCLA